MDYGIIGGSDGPTAVFVAGSFGEWNWINWFGVITLVLLLLPNVIYAIRNKGEKNLCTSKLLNVLEQVGRLGSMFFLIVYIGPEDGFGYDSVFALFCYIFGNFGLLLAYWICWFIYFRKPNKAGVRYALAILPSVLFLLDGLALWYMPLILFGYAFAVGHISVTHENIKKAR